MSTLEIKIIYPFRSSSVMRKNSISTGLTVWHTTGVISARNHRQGGENTMVWGIDDKVVHPKNNEFYLNSHVALQGTAKTPRYTVVFDQNNLSSDAITLCFGHQIVRLPSNFSSIPSLYRYPLCRAGTCASFCFQ